MPSRIVVACVLIVVSGGCQEAGGPAALPNPVAPASLAATTAARPWKSQLEWTVTNVQWAYDPQTGPVVQSTFGDRCAVPSDYVVTGSFEGQATHAGRVTGVVSHCSQLLRAPDGQLMGATYSDGRGTMTSANRSTLAIRYRNGVTGADPQTGLLWFRDDFTFEGGTGLFEGATGGGTEGGQFADFFELLGGKPVRMWMEGTITYSPGKR